MNVVWFDFLAGLCSLALIGDAKGVINQQFFNHTQNDAFLGINHTIFDQSECWEYH